MEPVFGTTSDGNNPDYRSKLAQSATHLHAELPREHSVREHGPSAANMAQISFTARQLILDYGKCNVNVSVTLTTSDCPHITSESLSVAEADASTININDETPDYENSTLNKAQLCALTNLS